jgi:hypothetical protein
MKAMLRIKDKMIYPIISLFPPFPKGDLMFPLFGKEGSGEILPINLKRISRTVTAEVYARKTCSTGGCL